MDDAYLTRCVVDPLKRKLYLYSSEGDEKTVDCIETMDQFMEYAVLCVIQQLMKWYHTSILFDEITNPLVSKGGKKNPPIFCSIRFL